MIYILSFVIIDLQLHSTEIMKSIQVIKKWLINIIKSIIVSFIWFIIIPILIGILVESITITPLRLTRYESAILPLTRCWGVGLFFLTLSTRFILNGFIDNLFEPIQKWNDNFHRVIRNGIENINMTYIFQEIFNPIFIMIFDIYFISYFISKSLGFLIFTSSYQTRTLLIRYSNISLILYHIISILIKIIQNYFKNIQTELFDKKYLIGRELVNNNNN